jgi:hypothetical protein
MVKVGRGFEVRLKSDQIVEMGGVYDCGGGN